MKLSDDDLKISKHVGVVLSVLKCFKWKLYRCICWLTVEVTLLYNYYYFYEKIVLRLLTLMYIVLMTDLFWAKSFRLFFLELSWLLHYRTEVRYHNEGKVITLQTWKCPEDSRRLRFPEFLDSRHMKVVSPTHPPPFTPGGIRGNIFYRCTMHLDTIKVLHLPTDALYFSLIKQ